MVMTVACASIRAGCDKCNQSGYKGRIGLHELLVWDDQVMRMLQARLRVTETLAVAGAARTLKMDGMKKVLSGMTDSKQVRSVFVT
jgi:type II secretory ATPase GspE/PulE/Tfp pilus assembly ATPase PilB-like protein